MPIHARTVKVLAASRLMLAMVCRLVSKALRATSACVGVYCLPYAVANWSNILLTRMALP